MTWQRALLIATALTLGILVVLQLANPAGNVQEVMVGVVGAITAMAGVVQQSPQDTRTENESSAIILPQGFIRQSQQRFRVSRSFKGGLYGGLIGGLVAGLYGGWSYYSFVMMIDEARPVGINARRLLVGLEAADLSLIGIAGPMVGFAALAGGLAGGTSQLSVNWFRFLVDSRNRNWFVFNDLTGALLGGLLAGIMIGGVGGVYFGSRAFFPIPHPAALVLWGSPAPIAILLGALAFDYRGSWMRLVTAFILAAVASAALLAVIIGLLQITNAYEALAMPFVRATVPAQYLGGLVFGLTIGGILGGVLGATSLIVKAMDRRRNRI